MADTAHNVALQQRFKHFLRQFGTSSSTEYGTPQQNTIISTFTAMRTSYLTSSD